MYKHQEGLTPLHYSVVCLNFRIFRTPSRTQCDLTECVVKVLIFKHIALAPDLSILGSLHPRGRIIDADLGWAWVTPGFGPRRKGCSRELSRPVL